MSGDSSQTRTNSILHSIVRALDRHSRSIDVLQDLRALKVEVKINQKTGRPRCVILMPELAWEAQPGQDDL